ncbi:hypothetical protein RIF29_15281 [Crotalaria pallida]|uniref:Uncharacterized protein n=1 Tax=Crotalaria pallida TaxID=3830 RepID=A0AAN9FGZ7_CROPI
MISSTNLMFVLLFVEVNDGSACCVFILFDSDVTKLIKNNCSELLNSSESVAFDDDYPADFKNLIGRTLLFKVVNTSDAVSSDTGVFKVRSVCDDPNIISIYELSGNNVSPTKAFPSSYVIPTSKTVPDNSSEIAETSAFVSDVIVTPVSLGDDCDVIPNPASSVKRKLEPEFGDDVILSSISKKRISRASKKAIV